MLFGRNCIIDKTGNQSEMSPVAVHLILCTLSVPTDSLSGPENAYFGTLPF